MPGRRVDEPGGARLGLEVKHVREEDPIEMRVRQRRLVEVPACGFDVVGEPRGGRPRVKGRKNLGDIDGGRPPVEPREASRLRHREAPHARARSEIQDPAGGREPRREGACGALEEPPEVGRRSARSHPCA